jgi:ATP-binding cassette subfamily B protein RaxB
MSVLRRLSFGFGRTIPVILQTEVAECGLACLAMVARHHGYEVDLASLRRRFSASLKGITLDSMVRIASSLGLTTRALRLDLHELRNLRLPCVLHWDLRHFVVLERVATNHATIVDPARGRRRVPLSEFSSSFTGVALEAWPGSDFERQSKRQRLPLICLFRRIVGLKRALVQIVKPCPSLWKS